MLKVSRMKTVMCVKLLMMMIEIQMYGSESGILGSEKGFLNVTIHLSSSFHFSVCWLFINTILCLSVYSVEEVMMA